MSIVFILVAAALVIATIEREINALWGISVRRPFARRLAVYLLGVTLGPVLVGASISVTTWLFTQTLAPMPLELSLADFVVKPLPLILSTLALALLYAMAPNRRVPWRHAFAGALPAAIAFEAAKHGFAHLREERADLRGRLRDAGRAAGVPDLDLRVLADRAVGGRDHRDADAQRGRARATARGGRATRTSRGRRGTIAAGADHRAHSRRARSGTGSSLAESLLPRYIAGSFSHRSISNVWSIVQAAGWPIWPLIFASVIALALIFERLWSLRQSIVAPPGLVDRVLAEYRANGATPELIGRIAQQGPLGRILATGLANVKSPRAVIKEAIEEVGRVVTHDLERFLTTLGTIAAMSPLLGLFGTVVGMIEIFGSQTAGGSNPLQLAHGISVALYNTAFGLIVAIPSMIFYRHFRATIDSLVVEMEQQAIKLVDFAHGERS